SGYRLPLDSLPWIAEGDRELLVGPDPFESRPPLPSSRDKAGSREPFASRDAPAAAQATRPGATPATDAGQRIQIEQVQTLTPRDGEQDPRPRLDESAAGVVRTALCVEARDGRLHVFLPPVRTAEDYLDL